jgi:hypothetical protein
VPSASHRGTRDAVRLERNLRGVSSDLLLICGKVAQATYEETDWDPPASTKAYYMKHPASRNWTNEEIEETAAQLQKDLDDVCQRFEPSGRET